jgi:photosystem II stability/assembly factor-like uncharacterized protein
MMRSSKLARFAAIRVAGGALVGAVTLATFGLGTPPALAAGSAARLVWRVVHSGGTADLRAISPVSRQVVWASGSEGTVLRTVDGGRIWRNVAPPGTSLLQFRGLKAFDADNAVIMSVGDRPHDFRLYRTSDGGAHWQLANENHNPQAFYDCMAFFDRQRGLVLSDPVDGKFRILITSDGGRSWRIDSPDNLPPANPGEYGFAASNTCITTNGPDHAWFGSGGTTGSRVFRSSDGGKTWSVAQTPIQAGATAGIFAVAFRNQRQGLATGGDFTTPASAPRALALTSDSGRTWSLVGEGAPGAYRSGAAWIPGRDGTAVAVGLTGSDLTTDGGRHWRRFDSGSFDTVACTPAGSCWASGANERIGVLPSG